MFRVFGLDQHFARALRAPGPPGDLHDRLCESLCRAKIRAEQSLVGVQYDDETHVGKMMALRQHLRADEQAHFARVDALERGFERAPASHRVAIDPREPCVREQAWSASPRCVPCLVPPA